MCKEIWVVPFFGQGHLLPSIELCKQISSRNFKTLLAIPTHLSSSIPSTLRSSPLLGILEIPSENDTCHRHGPPHPDFAAALETILGLQLDRPACAIVDVMMDWTAEIFRKFDIPTVAFFTSGACSAATEHATWQAQPIMVGPGEARLLPGLPPEMALTYSDLNQRPREPPGPPPPHLAGHRGPPGFGNRPLPPPGKGPPQSGGRPPWLDEVEKSDAVMINTCDDLELPFLDYLANQIEKPVWGVGPLLPQQYWNCLNSVVHDGQIRSTTRGSNLSEIDVLQWLDAKPHGSVLYVSFGSEVGPTSSELSQLAAALEASTRPFIMVDRKIPTGESDDFSGEFEARVGQRGLVIRGWAPQLMILSHPATGAFLSHCGWNSTAEAVGRAVPLLTWPIRGDQHCNAKLVAAHLRVGLMVCEDPSGEREMKKEDIVEGIERLMDDCEIKERAERLAVKFRGGFPATSVAALDAFRDFVDRKAD